MKIVKAVLAQNVGLTRDQLNQVMLELQSRAEIYWPSAKAGRPLQWGKFTAYVECGRILARAARIEV